MFIHDAVLEALICGDTHILVSDLHQAVERLKQKDEHNEGKTGFEQQFEVTTKSFTTEVLLCIHFSIEDVGASVT